MESLNRDDKESVGTPSEEQHHWQKKGSAGILLQKPEQLPQVKYNLDFYTSVNKSVYFIIQRICVYLLHVLYMFAVNKTQIFCPFTVPRKAFSTEKEIWGGSDHGSLPC